jgi:hypothetical protein
VAAAQHPTATAAAAGATKPRASPLLLQQLLPSQPAQKTPRMQQQLLQRPWMMHSLLLHWKLSSCSSCRWRSCSTGAYQTQRQQQQRLRTTMAPAATPKQR